MAAAIVPAAGKAAGLDSDLAVLRWTRPAKTKVRKKTRTLNGKKVQTLEVEVIRPEKDVEVHVNPKGLMYAAGAVVAGAVAAVGGLVAWNGIKVLNPLPAGDRTITLVPGLKDSPRWRRLVDPPLKTGTAQVLRPRRYQPVHDPPDENDRLTCEGDGHGELIRTPSGAYACVKK